MVFQRLSSLLKLNSIPNPHFKPGIILPPPPCPPTFRQMEPDTLSQPSVLPQRKKGGRKLRDRDNRALKALGAERVPSR